MPTSKGPIDQRMDESTDQRVHGCQIIVDEKQSSEPRKGYELDVSRFLEPPLLLIVISGPSGVGKEVHGVDYYFVSLEEFAAMLERDELLEYAAVYGPISVLRECTYGL
jgi:hypothetical protein